ncbi:hypothetical protein LJB99_06785, partial [Deltaproteobacteria bacterium OttesenSCG-928-K17]|nr:hypothetical protein [Deltaproteobacteria bacterium OttesenSCG-928-K17]
MVASKELIANIKLGLKAFDAAAKNLVLYPETNEMRQQSISILKNWLDPFLDEQTLRLHVAKGQLLFEDEVVFQDKSAENGIVSPLFRDGIHTLEIYQGVTLKELEKLLTLINTFRVIDEDQEDDMVTAMWEADFKFIKYNTADEFWEADDSVDVPTLNITSAADFRPSDNISENAGATDRFEQRIKPFSALFEDIQKEETPSEEAEGESEEEAPDDSAYTPNQWQLYLTFTDEEKAHLAAMIDAEKRRNVIGDSLDVLINLMYCRPDHPDNTMVLEFLSEEIQEALAASNFEDVRKCIGAVMTFSQSGHPSLTSLATEFSRMMSSEAALKALERSWTDPDAMLTEEYYREVYNFLSTLPPD